jgi:NADPH:quinone reductase
VTSKSIRFSKIGGPEVLEIAKLDISAPRPGEALVRHRAIGVNFIDVYHRSGLYPVPLPSGLGLEAAGIVEAIGDGVTQVKVGDRVGYGTGPVGAYGERHVVPQEKLIHLPDNVSDETAAAILLKGLTAQALLKQVRLTKSGDTILLHAAAGGVGLIASQWAKRLGATVIGVVGSQDKADLAREHGCDHVILGRSENIAERVRSITGGAGVPVVYDSVGKDTFTASLDSLAPLGLYVGFGNASGPPPPLDLADLSKRGSLFATRPTFLTYVRTPQLLRAAAKDLFEVVADGSVKVRIGKRFPLAQAAEAHRSLEARETTGSTILISD